MYKDSELFSNCSFVGRIDYICPEILEREIYDFEADNYPLGLIMLGLMSYDHPIKMSKNRKLGDLPKRVINSNNLSRIYNEYLRKLVLRFINENKKNRPTAEKGYAEIVMIEEFINNPNNLNIKKFLDKHNRQFDIMVKIDNPNYVSSIYFWLLHIAY